MKKLACCSKCHQWRTYEGDFSKNKVYLIKCLVCGEPKVIIHGLPAFISKDDSDRDMIDEDE